MKNVNHTILRFHLQILWFFFFCVYLYLLSLFSGYFNLEDFCTVFYTDSVSSCPLKCLCKEGREEFRSLLYMPWMLKPQSRVFLSVVPSIPCSRLALIGKILHPQQLMHSFMHAAMGMLMAWCATVMTKGQYSFLVVPCTGTER